MKNVFFILLISLLVATSVVSGACYETGQGFCKYYVSATNGRDDNYGTSWNEAFSSIQQAIDEAGGSSGHGVPIEVWVQQGTYNIQSSIVMYENVNVYGGFSGNETELSQRNSNAALTIIDGGGRSRILTQTNAFVLETVWDGFTFQNGKYESTSSSEIKGGGAVLLENNGKLSNCIIRNNSSNIHGAGVFMNYGGYLKNCVIEGNSLFLNIYGNSRQSGGGVFVNSSSSSIGKIENCQVKNNIIAGETNVNARGGGVYLGGGELHNSIVADNTAYQGGGVYTYASDATGSSNVSGCTIINNLSHHVGGGIYSSVLSNDADIYPNIVNCLVAHNTSNTGSGGIHAANGSSTRTFGSRIINCTIVRNSTTGTNTSYASYPGLYSQSANFVMNTIIWGNLAVDATTKKQFYVMNNSYTRFINNAIQDLNNPGDFASNGTSVTKTDLIKLSPDNLEIAFKQPSFSPGRKGEGWDVAEWVPLDSSKCTKAGVVGYSIDEFVASAPEKDIIGTTRENPPTIGAYEYTTRTNLPIQMFERNISIIVDSKAIITDQPGFLKVFALTGNLLISEQTDGWLQTNLDYGIYIAYFINSMGIATHAKIMIR